ncbi:type VII toxin-antitoxin system MntA family adenylyltransferase antitoxin [Nitratiruptor sp. SB155-2]|uniref:type VII toxin-antitoxin system MntA family adenylyltransferase antitoxin n=1 Tax=Nitratiruptor sp. (strain SB155-2) TaxID=387092 RepID=UPI00015873A7|nr:nucleotidyltransferase domain-containing protein [Nitratiruptor sp. SB155-2]BAF70471.1 nucleotidyltransferase [Nitratiruptor sp. SB155-2]
MFDKSTIVEKLKSYFSTKQEIKFAYLFGSVASDKAFSLSDIDIAVMCSKKCNVMELMAQLSYLLKFDEVEVVDLSQTHNLRLIKEIIQKGIVVKDSPTREEWELQKYHQALDFINHTKVIYGY